MSVILMTTLFYKALILQGENWYWSLLGLKGLNWDTQCLRHFNPQYPQTNSPDWSSHISFENYWREFDKGSKYLPFCEHFIDRHNVISWSCIDNIIHEKIDVEHFGDLTGLK